MQKRVVSLWFPRLPSNRVLRARPCDAPFVLTLHQQNADRIYCLNPQAEHQGLAQGMGYSDARAFCPDLQSCPADLPADAAFLRMLARWAKRYCPWVGLEGGDGLILNIAGSAHLFGGEAALLDDIHLRLTRAGITTRLGLADTRGAAWALAHFADGSRPDETLAPRGKTAGHLAALPIAALRLDDKTCVAIQRLGLRSIGDLIALPRASLTRRFGSDVLMRLDQALGDLPEDISPLPEGLHFGARMTLPDPIGLTADVMAGADRLLQRLCDKLKTHERGARVLCLTLRRVDQQSQQVELRLARPLRDPARILSLFERGVANVDAGFGIDQLRLEATQTEPLPMEQISHAHTYSPTHIHAGTHQLDDLITRIGTRIGLDNVQRFLPADSHIPEHGFLIAPAAYSKPAGPWAAPRPRPLRLFAPEPIASDSRASTTPPARFRWRRMSLSAGSVSGPERIAPEWWLEDDNWRNGLRDYWKVDTRQGRRLWLFYTPQNPGWFVQGEFA